MNPLENLMLAIEWGPVLISTLIAFIIGWAWYSQILFVRPWMNGLPKPPVWQAPMWMPMLAQLGATLFLAIIVNMSYQDGHVGHSVLVALTIMGFIKANGMYSGKNKMAISIEVLYILVMVLVMIGVNVLL